MTSKERVLAAINLQQPDKIPTDLGGTNCTTIAKKSYAGLKRILGVDTPDVIMMQDFQIVIPDDEVLIALEVDTRGVHGLTDKFPRRIIDERTYYNHFGIKFKMPDNGLYFDMVEHPLAKYETLDEMKEYVWPDPYLPETIEGLRERAQKLHEENKYAIVGDIVDSGIFEPSHYLRGMEMFFTDLLAEPDIAVYILENMLKFQMGRQEYMLNQVGEYLDIVFVGDDLAGTESTLISRDTYREMIKPLQKEYFAFIKKLAPKAKLMYHSCGAIEPFIDDLIEIGVDILNPVQVNAKGMDTKMLKEKYGERLCFCGGVDTNRVLPYGTVADVIEETRRRAADLGKGGGYIGCAVHDIQADVTADKVIAMYKTFKEI
jgi:uroporphyrinogen decarboxylase